MKAFNGLFRRLGLVHTALLPDGRREQDDRWSKVEVWSDLDGENGRRFWLCHRTNSIQCAVFYYFRLLKIPSGGIEGRKGNKYRRQDTLGRCR